MNLSPDILRTFVAAAQAGNFTHAGQKVHLTQSAVSMQINRLESDLGKPLFRRITRGVELTPDGESLLRYARRLLTLHDEALASLADQEPGGIIRLGAPEDLSYRYLPDILRSFSQKYPRVAVDLYCDTTDKLKQMVEKRTLDLCLSNDGNKTGAAIFLRNESVVWVAASDAAPEMDSPVPLALFHDGCMYRKWALDALDRQGIAYRIAYSSPSIAGIMAAVRSGMAVAPAGASIVSDSFRMIRQTVLPGLPGACINLYTSGAPDTKARSCLSRHIAEAVRTGTGPK